MVRWRRLQQDPVSLVKQQASWWMEPKLLLINYYAARSQCKAPAPTPTLRDMWRLEIWVSKAHHMSPWKVWLQPPPITHHKWGHVGSNFKFAILGIKNPQVPPLGCKCHLPPGNPVVSPTLPHHDGSGTLHWPLHYSLRLRAWNWTQVLHGGLWWQLLRGQPFQWSMRHKNNIIGLCQAAFTSYREAQQKAINYGGGESPPPPVMHTRKIKAKQQRF